VHTRPDTLAHVETAMAQIQESTRVFLSARVAQDRAAVGAGSGKLHKARKGGAPGDGDDDDDDDDVDDDEDDDMDGDDDDAHGTIEECD
jgi:hypothetical protein